MSTLILATVSRFLTALLLLVSIFLLFRGHNAVGGGFSSGLVASAAWALYSLAFSPQALRRALHLRPYTIITLGFAFALLSGLLASVTGAAFFTSRWIDLPLPSGQSFAIGTPILFEIGIHLVIVGSLTGIFLRLEGID